MRRIISFGIIAVLLISALGLSKSIWDSYGKLKRISETKSKEQVLISDTKRLKKELAERQSKEFIEEEARNKLGLSKPGETIYVVDGEKKETSNERVEGKSLANWQLWLKVFKLAERNGN
ncbi:MAG: septum formation initiator family protein [Candidatus Woykebacteria bacterium]